MPATVESQTIRVATFNVSMEASNYIAADSQPKGDELFKALATGEHSQIKNIAEIIQRVRPDIILLNEFDYSDDPALGVKAFLNNYLAKSQQQAQPIDYPYFFVAPVNTGVDSGLDLNNDGVASGKGGDAFGFGLYPGQYGMVLLSRFPIQTEHIRTFQTFLWKDMPGALIHDIKDTDGKDWYSADAKNIFRLSSKSHWDIPVRVGEKQLNILASHPTPPVFDGPEKRNKARNHDEIRFWNDYLAGEQQSNYLYDDLGKRGGFSGNRYVLVGDLNASSHEGDAFKQPIIDLIGKSSAHTLPTSDGGKDNRPDNPYSQFHTARWGLQVDYALASSRGVRQTGQGLFWPQNGSALFRLVEDRRASSDHRLVWIDIEITEP